MRLLSYNIHKGIGGRDRRYRIGRIVEVIESENPDLICLQEVDHNVKRSSYHDQPVELARSIRFEAHMFQLNVRLKGGGYGNLLLSRWPIVSRHQLCLRRTWRKPRGAQLAVVETPEGPLHLVNWHLGLAERERHWQVAKLLEHECFRAAAHLPTLIAGDFNDWRNRLARGPFARHGLHQATSPPSRFRSFPAYMPVAALDKAFHCRQVEVRHVRLVHSRLAREASDHLPLVVDFHINGHGRAPAEGAHAGSAGHHIPVR
jgi:endonuclease/exonuclease/phosphatase family metal-dependent hydrolase